MSIKAVATRSIMDSINYAATLSHLLARDDFHSAICNEADYVLRGPVIDRAVILTRTNATLAICRDRSFIVEVNQFDEDAFSICIVKEAFQITYKGNKFGMTFNQVLETDQLEETLIKGDFFSPEIKALDLHHAVCRGLEIFTLAVTQMEEA